ncbi:MAG: sensor histidine kinase [Bacteroidales bacterium]|nr:sensor histidine kinase [Bacteroidales bacterium]
MSKLHLILKKISSLGIIQHSLFWLLSFKVLLELFSSSSDPAKIDFIYTAVFLCTILIPVYINLNLSIPLLLSRRRYLLFVISFFLLTILFSGFNQLTFNKLIDFILKDYYFISYYDFFDITRYFFVFLLLTTLIKLSKAWFSVSEARQKLAEAEKQKVENELQALKSQINPHFMFNSLNNIYALALKKSDKTPEAILKLGDIMRYVIYEAREETVKLGKEIKFMRDYIDLQKIRSRNAKVIFTINNLDEEQIIAPLLFLPILENGFKHGIKGEREGYLEVFVGQENGMLTFISENNRGEGNGSEKPKFKGIGIENVRRRLEISYPGKHEFFIFEDNNLFRVEMKLELGYLKPQSMA